VILRSPDARTIKARELYFSVVVANCRGNTNGYNAVPYINGRRASSFNFSASGESVEVVGEVPARIFDKIETPCAFVRGGGYFTGTLLSPPIAIKERRVGA
jgi:hypothetical protein